MLGRNLERPERLKRIIPSATKSFEELLELGEYPGLAIALLGCTARIWSMINLDRGYGEGEMTRPKSDTKGRMTILTNDHDGVTIISTDEARGTTTIPTDDAEDFGQVVQRP
ncbi:Ribonuclease MRP protein subunit rmp1 [Neolecta irregularis DAH-3]|uniref:Ribonuclease MRP protein subunit rmp1 n=1 Tax=Neolecta irregularis (strain DAH-3) TaxID=1198029 RepID=A0A1U7LUN2_NEOID|nr:Ribonuclease MRP protein subunit rmp1 [Neolecta irregularis DAH-3]|eukprot:OLL26385.1 Ribonuclease MRP protein subunit rmp1 [Neolecta irregularis DAH-3]